MEVITKTRVKCPECGFAQEVEMPTDACQSLYQCVNCKFTLTPKEGDCCVFCSYAEIPCPSRQSEMAFSSLDSCIEWVCRPEEMLSPEREVK